ncbi:MAG: phosphotransferase family protein [Roseiflexaceae bacterium]
MDAVIGNRLWGDDGLAGVQWALLDPQPQAVLRDALGALLPDAGMLGDCRLHRAKYKPGRRLTTYYAVAVRDSATGAEHTRQIEVNWRPSAGKDPRGAMPELLKLQAEACDRGLTHPFHALLGEVLEWGMYIQVAPLDEGFPQLIRASDPAYVREMLAGADVASADNYAVTAIRYRPGQRHVLRYDPADAADRPAGDGTVFAKIYNSDKGARTFGVVTRMAEWLDAQGNGLTTVRPQAYIAGDGAVLYPYVSGTPLSDLLRAPGGEPADLLQRAGAALAALHRAPTTLVDLQPHSFAKEIKSITSAGEHVRPLLPEAGAQIAAILERAQALHERLPQEQPGFTHGDFKADHLWVTADGMTLLDFDTCYLFDPAIDLGKFLADLHYWYDRYGLSGVAEAREQFLAGYGPGASSERLLRAQLYEALVLIKTTVRRVRLFERDWAERTARLIDRAAALLHELEYQPA